MRDPSRIGPLLARIEAVWRSCPDLRLGQLIGNIEGDTYYMEDWRLVELVERLHQKSSLPPMDKP